MSNDEMEDIIKIVKSLEDSELLLKGISKTTQNEVKEQKRGFPSMLLGTLDATGKGINRAGYENKEEKRELRKRKDRQVM